MGTSIEMVERHYGALLDGSGAGIAARLDAFEDARDRAEEVEAAAADTGWFGPLVGQTG